MRGDGDNELECLYGGSCVGSQDCMDDDFYECECPPNRTGKNCEIYKDLNTDVLNMNDVIVSVTTSSDTGRATNNTNVLVVGPLILLFSIAITIMGSMFFIKRRRTQNLQASQRAAASDTLDDTFNNINNDDDDQAEENNNSNNSNDAAAAAMTKNAGTTGTGVNGADDFYDAEDTDDFTNDGIVNINLDDDDELPHPKAQIV